MKKVIAILLLTLALPAVADHHRGHALENMDRAQWNLVKAQRNAAALIACENYTQSQLDRLDGIEQYLGELDVRLQEARLAIEEVRLDDARFHLVQPVEHRFLEDGSPASSATRWAFSASAIYKYFVENACVENEYQLSSLIYNAARVWFFTDLVNWHVQDAIREEIYQDPAFICSGPNNHCE